MTVFKGLPNFHLRLEEKTCFFASDLLRSSRLRLEEVCRTYKIQHALSSDGRSQSHRRQQQRAVVFHVSQEIS